MNLQLELFAGGTQNVIPYETRLRLDRNFNSIHTQLQSVRGILREFVDASAGAVSFNLPAGMKVADKDYYIIKIDSSVNAVTVTAAGSETIEGSATATLAAQYNKIYLTFSAGVWYRLSP